MNNWIDRKYHKKFVLEKLPAGRDLWTYVDTYHDIENAKDDAKKYINRFANVHFRLREELERYLIDTTKEGDYNPKYGKRN